MLTFNHIHLLVKYNGKRNTILKSIQLIDGRTGQEYNQTKKWKVAFGEDRYHEAAFASEADSYMLREPTAAYGDNFASENDSLRHNAYFGKIFNENQRVDFL